MFSAGTSTAHTTIQSSMVMEQTACNLTLAATPWTDFLSSWGTDVLATGWAKLCCCCRCWMQVVGDPGARRRCKSGGAHGGRTWRGLGWKRRGGGEAGRGTRDDARDDVDGMGWDGWREIETSPPLRQARVQTQIQMSVVLWVEGEGECVYCLCTYVEKKKTTMLCHSLWTFLPKPYIASPSYFNCGHTTVYYSILQYTTVERTLVYVLVPIFSSFLKCLSSSSVCLNFPRPSVIPPTPNHPRRSHVVPFGEGALFGRAACTRLHTLPCTLPSSCNIKPSIQPGSSIPSVLQTNPCLPAKKKNP